MKKMKLTPQKKENKEEPKVQPNVYHIYKFPIRLFLTSDELKMKEEADQRQNDFINALKSKGWKRDLLTSEQKEVNKAADNSRKELSIAIKNHKEVRELLAGKLQSKYYIIGIAPSSLTRALNWQEKCKSPNYKMKDIIIVSANGMGKKYKRHMLGLLKELVLNGFTLKGKKYIFFTASAGQIRNREAMFILESEYNRISNTLTCGLTWERINEPDKDGNRGIIANKYMAYMALCSSSSENWKQLSINDCVVVDDFETLVNGKVEFVTFNKDGYSIKPTEKDVPITHTDGCGMILKSKSSEAVTIRGPWIKGLLVPFEFTRFIEEANKKDPSVNHGLVKDIYNKQHDILKENIKVIFTKSQFKMWKYYTDWDEYKDNFKEYGCEFAKCKKQSETVKYGKTSYQYLQTLTDVQDDELKELCSASNAELNKKSNDYLYMYKSHKSKEGGDHRPLWNAVNLYPPLLLDSYTKQKLREEVESFHNDCLGGRLVVSGKNTFYAPDLYAFCQHLFLNDPNPEGLIANGEVSCSLYKDNATLDCLRSPHWDKAHTIRTNRMTSECKKWFCKQVCFTSCHDLITKILQADFDGDTGLVCDDETLVKIAERNTIGAVPLYYEMPKGKLGILTLDALYEGMKAAYRYSIGTLANPITQLWSQHPDEKAIEYIKLFTAASNFYTDYAKTLYTPELPLELVNEKNRLSKEPMPYFWRFTDNFKSKKNKKDKQIKDITAQNNETSDNIEYLNAGISKVPTTSSTVDCLGKYIDDKSRINLDAFRKQVTDKIEYTKLMNNPKAEINVKIVEAYKKMSKTSVLLPDKVYKTDEESTGFFSYVCSEIKDALHEIEPDDVKVTDMLIKYLFSLEETENARKAVFWKCYGDIVCNNLSRNFVGTTVCPKCLKRFKPKSVNEFICPECK